MWNEEQGEQEEVQLRKSAGQQAYEVFAKGWPSYFHELLKNVAGAGAAPRQEESKEKSPEKPKASAAMQ